MLTKGYSESATTLCLRSAISKTRVYKWYKSFQDGLEDVEDDERSERTSTLTTDKNMEKVEEMPGERHIFERGCLRAGEEWIETNLVTVAAVKVGIMVLQNFDVSKVINEGGCLEAVEDWIEKNMISIASCTFIILFFQCKISKRSRELECVNNPDNLGDVSDEHGERFHQQMKAMGRRYHGFWDAAMVAPFPLDSRTPYRPMFTYADFCSSPAIARLHPCLLGANVHCVPYCPLFGAREREANSFNILGFAEPMLYAQWGIGGGTGGCWFLGNNYADLKLSTTRNPPRPVD
ncbi:unnamed protein product [Brassicogethes aeneus]|uniref:Mos1 transposase HTH domain-containing protein n=1 Tax=Brassicogethes aeneus TaxID=1431903 RepID=A0A9P0B1V3_BRAAE|nr:unnamed protein product [Brassicogethes aeneus]